MVKLSVLAVLLLLLIFKCDSRNGEPSHNQANFGSGGAENAGIRSQGVAEIPEGVNGNSPPPTQSVRNVNILIRTPPFIQRIPEPPTALAILAIGCAIMAFLPKRINRG